MSIIRTKGLSLNIVLLALIGFFATWGEGMQKVISRASIIYPALAAVYMFFYYNSFIRSVRGKQIVPKEFKWLYVFILIHSIIYISLNFQSIGFGSEMGTTNDEGFAYGKTESGIVIIRYFLFLLFCLYLTVAFDNEYKLKIFAISFVIGFMCTILLGGAFHSYANALVRFSGGVQDPNVMAFDALVALIFSVYLYKSNKMFAIRMFLIVSFVIELLAVFLSFSRGAYLALAIWTLLYMIHKGLWRNIWKVIMGLVIFSIIGYMAMRNLGIDSEIVETRFSLEEMQEKKGANRGLIWETYLTNFDKYFVFGMGIGNSPKVMIGNKLGVSEAYESHNLYIQFFAEYGFIGLLLYLLYWRGYMHQNRRTQGNNYILMTVGWAFLVVTFFLNIDKGRTFWIVLAIINTVWMRNIQSRKTIQRQESISIDKHVNF